MHIAIARKKNTKVEELVKLIMSVGAISFYQLMQVCQAEYFRQLLKPVT